MPDSTRHHIKRCNDQAMFHLSEAITNLVKAGHNFDGVHPVIYDKYSFIVSALEQTKTTVKMLNDEI